MQVKAYESEDCPAHKPPGTSPLPEAFLVPGDKRLLRHTAGPHAAGKVRSLFLRRRKIVREDGGALVEMAVILPVLLLIVTGILTFGIALNNYLQLTDAVGISARLLAISRQQTLDPCATVSAAFYKAAPYLKQANLNFTFVLNGTSYSGASCSSSSYTTGAAGNLQQGASAQITVTYPCNLAVYGTNYAPSCTLQAQTTEIVQ